MAAKQSGRTVVVRIPLEMWDRIGRLQDRIGKDMRAKGLDAPSRSSILRASLDLGIHTYGRRIGKTEKKQK